MPVYGYFVILWILSMIALPIANWTTGDTILPLMVTIAALFQVGAVALALLESWGSKRLAMTAVGVGILAWLVEWVGSTTGFPFGSYDYSARLQPQLGHVPILIPLAWFMMLPCAWSVASLLVGTRNRLVFIMVSALAFTAWDLYLDPQMVNWGFWVWEHPDGYFGIPWVNFLGWLLASSLITFVVKPDNLPHGPLVLIYGITWILQAIGLGIFWGLVGPALVGFGAMGFFLALAARKLYGEYV